MTIQVLGAGAILLSPLIGRAEGSLLIGLKGIRIDLADRKRAEALLSTAIADADQLEVLNLVTRAPHRALAGILPLLTGTVATEVFRVPAQYEGATLQKELSFVRQEHQVAVIALRHPGRHDWSAGGSVTTEPLQQGTELLVAGTPDSIDGLRVRLES